MDFLVGFRMPFEERARRFARAAVAGSLCKAAEDMNN